MKLKFIAVAALSVSLVAGQAAMGASTLTKSPDLGDYWAPLSSGGTYVYADSFVAPTSGTVSALGTWLNGGSSQYVLEVLADTGGFGPNGASILAQTAVQQGTYNGLTYVNFLTTSSASLVAGQTYWFAASTVGLGGSGSYNTGGHTQDSQGIVDGGTFWYSNDSAGLSFDGQNLTPEMAFTVTQGAVPEPAAWIMMLAGFGIIGAALRRRATATTVTYS
jgi:hypothetical protein